MAPGTLVHVGERRVKATVIREVIFSASELRERTLDQGQAPVVRVTDQAGVAWYDVLGLHEVDVIESIGAAFGLHPLVIEDILNPTQRPKVQETDGSLLVELNALGLGEDEAIRTRQISLLLVEEATVLSFRESAECGCIEAVRERLENPGSRLRRSGADYMLYALMDSIVDSYYPVLEALGEAIDALEGSVSSDPTPEMLDGIWALKGDALLVRRSLWPLREVVTALLRRESAFLGQDIEPYLHDLYDHVVQLMDTLEIMREILSGMVDVYLSSTSYRLNKVMKVLTIISTLFIPLTFVAGVYGMNFVYMPELHWRYGYCAIWILMIVVAGFMVALFRRHRWL